MSETGSEYQHAGKKRRLEEANESEPTASSSSPDGADLPPAEYKNRVRIMLSNLSKEAIVEILADLGAIYQPVYDHVQTIANKDEANRKLFLHGLNWESTNESLRKCLEEELHFGAVESTHVVVDKQTGKSKAFGFATFVSFDGALACVEASKKDALVIDGRVVKANFAAERDKKLLGGGAAAAGSGSGGAGAAPSGSSSMNGGPGGAAAGGMSMGMGMGPGGGGGGVGGTVVDKTLRKFFLRSLPFSATEETLKAHFLPAGEVEEAAVVREKDSQKSKGYGFVTMRYLEGAQAVFMRPPRFIEGREVIIQLAAQGKDGPQLQGNNTGMPLGYGTPGLVASPMGMVTPSQAAALGPISGSTFMGAPQAVGGGGGGGPAGAGAGGAAAGGMMSQQQAAAAAAMMGGGPMGMGGMGAMGMMGGPMAGAYGQMGQMGAPMGMGMGMGMPQAAAAAAAAAGFGGMMMPQQMAMMGGYGGMMMGAAPPGGNAGGGGFGGFGMNGGPSGGGADPK